MSDRKSSKLYISHPNEEGCQLVGVLEQISPEEPTNGRKIALVSSLFDRGLSACSILEATVH
ncbi:hypothetical protein BV22DRAFT_1075205 [Leucogyrophana mollusca]|uniref:Uncharacterized protein n=1 Tax=Leucogyrophana mollusca TaxID=85980 RepID=A0ACB8B2J2_9AGAM|nr:hypothetical protein BV22DRAFT_1075205 [Leucogyrophana mollusca]